MQTKRWPRTLPLLWLVFLAAAWSSAALEDKPASKGSTKEESLRQLLEAGKPGDFPKVPWERRTVRDTGHYRLETNTPEMTARYVHCLLERLYPFYSQRLGTQPRGKMNAFIFAQREDFVAEVAKATKAVGPETQGLWLLHPDPRKSGLYVPWTATAGGMEPYQILLHEGLHQFYHAAFGTGEPVWLNEGLATYFEGAVFDGERLLDGRIARNRAAWLQRNLKDGKAETLEKLLGLARKDFKAEQYCLAWGLVYWCAWGQPEMKKNRETQQRFGVFLNGVGNPRGRTPEAFERAMGRRLKDIEADWTAWARSLDPKDPFGGKGDPLNRK